MQTPNIIISWAWGHCAKHKSHTCDWKSDHQGQEQGAINLIRKIYCFAPPFELKATVSHITGTVWGYCYFCLQPALYCLALSISKWGLLRLNFYSWTCSKGEFGYFSPSWVFTSRPTPSMNFPGTHTVWHMLFFFWESHWCWTQWQLMFETNFCAFCNVKSKSANQSGRRSSYDSFTYITLKHSQWMKFHNLASLILL